MCGLIAFVLLSAKKDELEEALAVEFALLLFAAVDEDDVFAAASMPFVVTFLRIVATIAWAFSNFARLLLWNSSGRGQCRDAKLPLPYARWYVVGIDLEDV